MRASGKGFVQPVESTRASKRRQQVGNVSTKSAFWWFGETTSTFPLLTERPSTLSQVFSEGCVLGRLNAMSLKLSQELADALSAAGNGELAVVNPNDNQVYFLVREDTHRQAMDALRRQQDRDAIAKGIAQMEAGEGMPLEEARKLTRDELLSREQ